MADFSHNDALPYPTYASDAVGFAQMVAQGWPFVMHKLTQGSNFLDPKVLGRLASAATIPDICLGVYHFMDDSPIHEQLANFSWAYMELTSRLPKGMFVRFAVDNEPSTLGLPVTPSSDRLAAQMAEAMFMVKGKMPLIYGDASEFASVASCGFMGQCPRWLAKYGPWATSSQWGPAWSSGEWQQFSDGTINTLGVEVPGFANTSLDMSAYSGSDLQEAITVWSR
jgi:hypothetical protein